MSKRNCPSHNELSGYALGTLPPTAADEVTEHIAECSACEDTLQSLSPTADSLIASIQAPATPERFVQEPACVKVVSQLEGNAPAKKGPNSIGATPALSPSNSSSERARAMNHNEFVEFVTTTELVSNDELTAITKGRPAAETTDVQALAKTLVQHEKLTKYQAAAIYQGKGKSLFYGDYLVLDRIGAGGMGQVFKARHRRMDRVVALKVMSAAAIKSADAVKRFEREVRAAAKLTHPNIVHAYDAGLQDGARYLVMEYVEGSDLSQLLRQQTKFGVKQACGFIEQAARGFAAAHAKGVVHRDVKPGNLLLDKSGVVKVLDMGLARFDDEGIGGAMSEGELTQTGSVMGTVDYMAPEQALDTRHADAKSDVYGLGCTLFRVVTGEPVYAGRTLVEKILAHRDHPIPTVRKFRPEAPPALDQLLARMLAKSPADRPTMQEVADGLASIDFTNSKAGSLDIPLAPISTGLPPATGPAAAVGFGAVQTVQAPLGHAPLPNVGGPTVRPRTAGAAPPRKKSILPLLAAAGAGGLLILGGVWVYIKDKDGKNVAVVEVPEGGSVQMATSAPPAITPAPVVSPSATPSATTPMFTTPTVAATATPTVSTPTVSTPAISTNAGATATTTGTASAADAANIVCTKLIARREPVGLSPDAVHFAGPPIDRAGANGFTIKAPADWRTAGTAWTFDYRCNQWDNGIQMIHPIGDGHMRMVLMTNFLGLAPGGPWGIEGIMKYYLPADRKLEPLASTVYPLNNTDTYRVKSVCDAAGNYTLSINDQVIVKRQVGAVSPQQLKPPFVDPKCPDVIAVGDAALIMGPAAAPGAGVTIFNEANDVRLTTAGPALVASATPSIGPTTAQPPVVATERDVALAVIAKGGKVQVTVAGRMGSSIESPQQLPIEPFEVTVASIKGSTDQDLAILRNSPNLKTIDLRGNPITDEGLIHLSELKNLEWLNIGKTNVRGPGVRHLVSLPKLASLRFEKESLDDSAVPYLAQMKQIKQFEAGETDLSDLSFASALPGLENISVGRSRIGSLSGLTGSNVKGLSLINTYILDEDLVALKGLKTLQDIYLEETDISDAGLKNFDDYPKIGVLALKNTYVTEAGVARFRAKFPQANIQVKTKAGSVPSQRRPVPPPKNPPLIASTPIATTSGGPTPTPLADMTPDPSLVCTTLAAKAKPIGLAPDGIAFDGPNGDGRRGANGILLPAPSDWRTSGTRWSFNYSWSRTGAGVIMIHPFAGGHFRIVVRPEGADIIPGGPWASHGGYTYSFAGKYPMLKTADTATIFPLKEGVVYALTSRVDQEGNYQLLVNDKLVYSGQVVPTAPLGMKPPFEDPKCPDVVAAGYAGLIIGPRDGGTNEASQIQLLSNARIQRPRTTPAVASVPATSVGSPTASPPAVTAPPSVSPAAERAAAIAVLAKQGKIKIEVNGRRSDITSPQQLPSEPFHVVEISFYQMAAITDQDLVPVRQMPELRDIDLLGTSISDEGLANFAGAQNLNRIHLTGTNIHGPGIRHLINCPKLVTVRFGDKSLDDSAVPFLAQMKQVESFDAVRTDLSDLSFVRSMPNLTYLHVGGGHSRIGSLAACAGSKLTTLNAEGAPLIDDDLRVLQGVKTLTSVNFSGADITDASMKYFEDHPAMNTMYLNGTFVTEAGVAKLRAKFPGAKINVSPKAGSPPTPRRPIPAPKYSTGLASSTSPAAATAMAALPAFAPPPSAAPSTERKALPSSADQQTALKAIKEIFADDYAAAKTPDQKSALATKLLDQARQTNDDATSKFVLLNEVRTLALDAGVLGPLSDALQSQIEEFDLDSVATRLDAWNALLKRPRIDSFTIQQLTKEATTLFNQAVVDADFDNAKRYGDFTLATTRRLANSAATIKLLTERNTALAARQKEWPTLVATAEKLKANPADPEANLTIARYLSLAAEDWPGAFPLYAKAGDPQFAELGAKSLKALDDTSAQVAAGDAWWDAAQAAKLPLKQELLGGANYWYTAAVPLLSGLPKTRIEKRIAEMAPQIPTKKIFASTLPSFSGPAKLDNSGAVPFDQRAMPNKTFGEPSSSTPTPQPTPSTSSSTGSSSNGSTSSRGVVAPPNGASERQIIAYYQSLGGYVSIRLAGAMGNTALKAGDPIPDGQFKIEAVSLANVKNAGDNELIPLQGLPNIDQVFLNGTSITAKGLANLRNSKVKAVILSGNPHLTDEVIPYLAELPELASIILNDAQITDRGIAQLKDCKKLVSLLLAGTQVTGVGFSQFPDDSLIQSLTLGNTPVNDAGLSQIKRLRNIKSLHIEKTQITDQGLSNIKDLDPSMVDLTGTNTSDACLQFFRNMQNLKTLYVSAGVSDAGMQALQSVLPNCKVKRKQ